MLTIKKLSTSLILCALAFSSWLDASQVVLISGASRGIGLATAELLAQEGYNVYAGVRGTSSREALSNAKTNLHIIELDVTDQNSVDRAVAAILDVEGRIDVLVNSAGIAFLGSAENHTIEEAQKIFDVNFFGVMRLQQAVLPAMRAQKSGRIIQMSSRSGFRPHPYFSVYAASKFALEGLSETMAATLKPWNIKVSLIQPGPVRTDFDYISSYASHLPKGQDPYFKIFESAGMLDPYSPNAQEPLEIATLIQTAIEAENPLLRYQTSKSIELQAAERLVDPTGLKGVKELQSLLF